MPKSITNTKTSGLTFASIVVAIGLAIGGYFIGSGVYRSLARRTVTVKGLAEMDVTADLAIWNLKVSRSGTDLIAIQKEIDADIIKVKNFLKSAGFKDDELQNQRISVQNEYTPIVSGKRPPQRYSIGTGVTVRSADVNRVDATSRRMGEIVRQGIKISEDYRGPSYIFNGLNDIKIPMIEKATKNATDAGKQFAKDANTSLGKIQSANQGVFSIDARDQTSDWTAEKESIHKKVRVVSTITFYLK